MPNETYPSAAEAHVHPLPMEDDYNEITWTPEEGCDFPGRIADRGDRFELALLVPENAMLRMHTEGKNPEHLRLVAEMRCEGIRKRGSVPLDAVDPEEIHYRREGDTATITLPRKQKARPTTRKYNVT